MGAGKTTVGRSLAKRLDWQIEDILPMYKPAAATYLGETSLVGFVDTTDGFEHFYHETYGATWTPVDGTTASLVMLSG